MWTPERARVARHHGARRQGHGSFSFTHPPLIAAACAVAGPDEAKGPLGDRFDVRAPDYEWGETSFERSERKFLRGAMEGALGHAAVSAADVDVHLGGDLLDQLTSHSLSVAEGEIPFMGLFSACATCGSGIGLGATLLASGAADHVLVTVASHYYTAERQFRFPTELGVQRKPTSQRTATGAVGFVLSAQGVGEEGEDDAADGPAAGRETPFRSRAFDGDGYVRITHFTPGRVRDLGVKDTSNLGAAEAPAAADTLLRHFAETGCRVEDYDLVMTGDLAGVGLPLAQEICRDQGLDLGSRWQDAGLMLYGPDQEADAGGSGAACCALVLAAEVLPRLASGAWGRVLFVATGSLHSKTTYEQGESIPCVAHAVELEGPGARPLRSVKEARP